MVGHMSMMSGTTIVIEISDCGARGRLCKLCFESDRIEMRCLGGTSSL